MVKASFSALTRGAQIVLGFLVGLIGRAGDIDFLLSALQPDSWVHRMMEALWPIAQPVLFVAGVMAILLLEQRLRSRELNVVRTALETQIASVGAQIAALPGIETTQAFKDAAQNMAGIHNEMAGIKAGLRKLGDDLTEMAGQIEGASLRAEDNAVARAKREIGERT